MKEKPYYYPEPESIYIGMECERKVSKNLWAKRTLTRADFLNYVPFSEEKVGEDSFAQKILCGEEIIRIKRLCPEDLEEICGEVKEELNESGVRQHSGIYNGKEIVLVTTDLSVNRAHAYVSIYVGLGTPLFHGRIKNKQELLHILEMVE
jgi:hypothetical protein